MGFDLLEVVIHNLHPCSALINGLPHTTLTFFQLCDLTLLDCIVNVDYLSSVGRPAHNLSEAVS